MSTDRPNDYSERTIWCQCYGTPEPDGPWIHPDDEHADTHGIDALDTDPLSTRSEYDQ